VREPAEKPWISVFPLCSTDNTHKNNAAGENENGEEQTADNRQKKIATSKHLRYYTVHTLEQVEQRRAGLAKYPVLVIVDAVELAAVHRPEQRKGTARSRSVYVAKSNDRVRMLMDSDGCGLRVLLPYLDPQRREHHDQQM
jgi:hypothetical protein